MNEFIYLLIKEYGINKVDSYYSYQPSSKSALYKHKRAYETDGKKGRFISVKHHKTLLIMFYFKVQDTIKDLAIKENIFSIIDDTTYSNWLSGRLYTFSKKAGEDSYAENWTPYTIPNNIESKLISLLSEREQRLLHLFKEVTTSDFWKDYWIKIDYGYGTIIDRFFNVVTKHKLAEHPNILVTDIISDKIEVGLEVY